MVLTHLAECFLEMLPVEIIGSFTGEPIQKFVKLMFEAAASVSVIHLFLSCKQFLQSKV